MSNNHSSPDKQLKRKLDGSVTRTPRKLMTQILSASSLAFREKARRDEAYEGNNSFGYSYGPESPTYTPTSPASSPASHGEIACEEEAFEGEMTLGRRPYISMSPVHSLSSSSRYQMQDAVAFCCDQFHKVAKMRCLGMMMMNNAITTMSSNEIPTISKYVWEQSPYVLACFDLKMLRTLLEQSGLFSAQLQCCLEHAHHQWVGSNSTTADYDGK
jgi:hypothetical protein